MLTNTAEFRNLIERRSFIGGSPLVQGPEKRSDAEPSGHVIKDAPDLDSASGADAVGVIRNAAEEMREDENWRAP